MDIFNLVIVLNVCTSLNGITSIFRSIFKLFKKSGMFYCRKSSILCIDI